MFNFGVINMGLEDLRRKQAGLSAIRKCNNLFYWLLAFSPLFVVLFFFSCIELLLLTASIWSHWIYDDAPLRFLIVMYVIIYWSISRLIYWSDVRNVNFANDSDVVRWQYSGLFFIPLYVIFRVTKTSCSKIPAVVYFLMACISLVITVYLVLLII